ncbi:unnamed protein product [Rhizophagus irregularis]|uniref:Transposase domain-containing protein n=1 Tax=Rhizophagus irregularis TaxID=588596 RepID=A0A916E7H8_9GLOM|nr:unnamed protein product [Rhizophagus irregularis]
MSFPNPKPNETPDQYVAMEIDESIIIEGSSEKVVNSEKDSAEQELRNLPEVDNYEPDFEYTSQKRRRQDKFREPEADQNNENPGDDDDGESESGISLDDDVTFLSDDETPVEQFTAPDFDNNSEFVYPNTNINYADSWILIWIYKYQSRFRLSDVAIDSLIKFFQQILMDADQARFKNFPSSLYTASKLLQVGNQSKTYAVCPSCNSLYNIAEVVAEEGSKCTHVEFPMQSKGKPCGMELTVQAPLVCTNDQESSSN